ncbi:SDR family NAD(P)-dependent oxidoreductase [Virgibacillus sp. NKC19-16]|uniref:SDR family NAD(P)-dependent oxidoreductase n=1 Tax=Virgibacillus salidurans TaxID=2831673 RepID=UPI001F20E6E3|nr:SDR family NAD(P)-dependent oxidoreductase [Virgibacillus sp. NKC19-16]UJL45783.1 SDR family NAD(P)-dependent oxidoreductase [Virgibacillus sp. NKC19-16]
MKEGAKVVPADINEEGMKEVENTINNNAEIGTHRNIETTTYEAGSAFPGKKYGSQAMIKNENDSSIINMSSVAGLVDDSELLAYAASKDGVKQLTKEAALHLAKNKTKIAFTLDTTIPN